MKKSYKIYVLTLYSTPLKAFTDSDKAYDYMIKRQNQYGVHPNWSVVELELELDE